MQAVYLTISRTRTIRPLRTFQQCALSFEMLFDIWIHLYSRLSLVIPLSFRVFQLGKSKVNSALHYHNAL